MPTATFFFKLMRLSAFMLSHASLFLSSNLAAGGFGRRHFYL